MVVLILSMCGVVFGSFVNALVWRLHINKTIWNDRSECPQCHHKLAARDLIPIFSWVLLKGKCRYCQHPISWQYPAVELSTGLLFALSYVAWPIALVTPGDYSRFVIWLVALVAFVAMFVYDVRWMKLPSSLLYLVIALGLLQAVVLIISSSEPLQQILTIVASTAIGGGLFGLLYLLTRGNGIGDGDIWLGVGFGLILADPLLAWLAITIASVTGSLVGLGLVVKGKGNLKLKVPFGPFLICGVVVAGLFGAKIWDRISVFLIG